MSTWQKLKSDVEHASPITLVLLGSLVLYAVYAVYHLVLAPLFRTVGRVVTARRTTDQQSKKERKSNVEQAPAQSSSLSKDVSNDKKTKGLKQLLKESKQAKAASSSYENVPDTDLYLNTLKGHSDSVVSVQLSGDNKAIITASEDKIVRIFDMKGDLATTKPALTRVPLKETPLCAMFWGGRDSLAACTAGLGQVANLFAVQGVYQGRTVPTPQKVAERLHDSSEVSKCYSVPDSPGGRPLLATLTKTKEAKVTDGNGKLLATVQPAGINNYQIALSRDGRFLAVTTWACDMKIWELAWGRDKTFTGCSRAMELKGHTSGITCVAFNAAATRAATCSKDGTLRIWNLDVRYKLSEDAKCLKSHRLQGKPYENLAWCENGTLVATLGTALHYVDSVTGRVLSSISDAHTKGITALSVSSEEVRFGSANGYVVVTASKDHKARIWAVPDAADS